MVDTPQTYPAEVTVSDEEFYDVKETVVEKGYIDEWPPTDYHGNIFPIFFTADELNSRGRLVADNGREFSPFTGNLEPIFGEEYRYCNAPVGNWRVRYPEIRYCGQIIPLCDEDRVYCKNHRGRRNTMKSAEEMMQTGMFASSVDHLYENLDPWKKLMGWGTFESLMGESRYEFAPEYDERTLDFSEQPFQPDEVDDDGILDVKFGYPTARPKRALMLYVAAMQTVQMVSVQPKIMDETGPDKGMMESKTVEKAQLTAPPSEHDPSPQEFQTIETWSEHHLNLPLSRLIKDQPRLLEMGGVVTDPEDDSDDVAADDLVMELNVEAEGDGIESTSDGTDPNYFGEDGTAQSEKIMEHASNDD